MSLIAAAVCTKSGNAIISRQFVAMTRARIEGLLCAFPSLKKTDEQHTFVETDSVRYVYQPMEKLYMVLITTKVSNILEDLETLNLFVKVIAEYCTTVDENGIAKNAFNLIFAFDEIVALGYRENVNLTQIREFVKMDSHEEDLYLALRKTQERDANNKMREKAKEFQRQRMERLESRDGFKNNSSTGFGNKSSGFKSNLNDNDSKNNIAELPAKANDTPPRKPPRSRGMKLGGKVRDVDSFVDQLNEEGENIKSTTSSNNTNVIATTKITTTTTPQIINSKPVHLKQEEKLSVRLGRDGGVQNFELHGLITLHITDERWGKIRVQLANNDTRGIQLQTHPNVDKDLFRTQGQIGLKVPTKPFPINTDVGVLKWRLQSQDETSLPISINCWPSENGENGCDVNIEYELVQTDLELNNLQINIPLPMGCNPIVNECDGEYQHEARRNMLVWSLTIVDASSKSGSLEFSAPSSKPSDFFPLSLSFTSQTPYAKIKIVEVSTVEDQSPVKYSHDILFVTEDYQVV
ncbi:hypothetical protein HCN44_008192 [Aphidius gifuensis]|uniref:Coatomer subunit delta n=1 Tax=Aphidius gifuensis TaxID=684658 RepID=A0A834XLP9_APHGI|nr:coatomer subunit delta-like [Aphidius gifuensis]KAF7989518.1 hypothetical protein HCN44_008192 [Aphidius gifuensis]